MKKVFFILLAVLIAGCFGGDGATPVTYVTPCSVIAPHIMFRANGTVLSTETVKGPLAHALVDDLTSEKAAGLKQYYGVSCYWGSNVGERKDHYYCNGSYVAPDVDEHGVIVRNLKKQFKIGFSVESFKGETWVDMGGKIHTEETYFDLTVSSVEAKCTVF